MKNITTYLSIIGLILNATLIYSLYTLPTRINEEINKQKIDTTSKKEVVKVISEKLETKTNFIYFEGQIVSKSYCLKESYVFDTRYPTEIYDGYITKIKSNKGSLYYLWSSNELNLINEDIKGYFVTDNIGYFQTSNDDTLQILYPIVRRN